MAGESVAGHSFNLSDHCTLPRTDGTTCPVRWLDIHDADDGCVGHLGWAHYGKLTAGEVAEIRAERERRAAVFERVMSGRAEFVEAEASAWGEVDRADEPAVTWMEMPRSFFWMGPDGLVEF